MILDKKLEQIIKFLSVPSALVAPSLVLVEDENVSNELYARMWDMFQESGFMPTHQADDTLEALKGGGKKIVYFERSQKLANSIESLMTEYATGMLSTSTKGGMSTIKFSPSDTMFVIVMARAQAEASYPKLFEYAGNIETL